MFKLPNQPASVEERIDSMTKRNIQKYQRPSVSVKGLRDRKLRAQHLRRKELGAQAAVMSAMSEVLLPMQEGLLQPEGLEKTSHYSQREIAEHLDLQSSRKTFDLSLDVLGPYCLDYTRNGRFLALAGRRGHLALLEWSRKRLLTELHVQEAVHDIKFLHNETMFAVAQRKAVFIYDNQGVELHCLRDHRYPLCLEFLPYHFLLVSVNNSGRLRYIDISTGAQVVEHPTRLGPCNAMCQNPWNAVMCLGHSKGIVTLWTPNMTSPLVKLLAHRGPVQAITVDAQGRYLVTAGMDSQLKVWDIRNFKILHQYLFRPPAVSVSLSQRGLLAVGGGAHLQVWKDSLISKANMPYLEHLIPGSSIQCARFCPYEDFLGVGHNHGFSSVVVPGAGEPNFDSFEADPFQTKRQRQEAEVHSLLEKIPAAMITLDPCKVGTVDAKAASLYEENRKSAKKVNRKERRKARGRDTATKRVVRKQRLKEETARLAVRNHDADESPGSPTLNTTLDIFNPR